METNLNNSNKNSLQKLEEWINNFRKTATGPKMQVFDAAADKLLDLIYFLDKSFANNSNETENNEPEELKDMGEVSDGYHTFNELYYYRMLYNAAFFNMLPKDMVHKSKRHHTGEECFGGGWFIVMANLPTGQISNHYELKDWDLFQIPEKERADEWDGHTPQQAAEKLHEYLLMTQDKKYNLSSESTVQDKENQTEYEVGDWVVFDHTTNVITELPKNGYVNVEIRRYAHAGSKTTITQHVPIPYIHKWTLDDARPGDVLTFETENRKWTFIYNKIVKKSADLPLDTLKYYALLSEEEFIDNGTVTLDEDCSAVNFRPATLVEQDVFFSEMKESGYEWDWVKREVKKTVETSADAVNTKTEKHKPLFKIGDWVVHDLSTGVPAIRKIIDMTNKSYVLDGDCFNCFYFKDLEESFHLWTIEDARPGDILAAHECYVMFKEIDGLNIRCFCTYHYMNHQSFYLNTLQNKSAFHPATEEECKEMLSKMKKEGYAFDPVHNDLIAVQNETPDESKEPDGEKIRKAFTEFLKNASEGYLDTSTPYKTFGKWLAWLEQQKETNTKSSVALSIMNFLDKNTQKMCLSNMECEDLKNAVINSDWAKVYRYMKKKLEPNGSKPAMESQKESAANNSKIKPKFKEGSYAVSDIDKKARLVSEVHCDETNCYYLINGLVYDIVAYDKLHHNWTIDDAHTGDILVASDNSVFIFNGIKDNHALYYAAMTMDGFVQISDGMHAWEDVQGCHPATSKQCQLLFELMYRIGYTWDETAKMPIKSSTDTRSACKALCNIGDWLASKQHYALKIIGITTDEYITSENSDGEEIESSEEIEFVDRNYHIWTIDDARNGDILASKDRIFIFRKSDHTKPTEDVRSYCHYDIETDSFEEDDEFVTLPLDMKVQPATAEQYNIFFKKMKESGYEWDESIKELNELED